MSGLLRRILENKAVEVAALTEQSMPDPPPLRRVDLKRAPREALHLLAEIKRRSPSAGALSCSLSVAERAKTYERCGAALISVLTDEKYFGGSFRDLREARNACSLPLMCKDFVLDEIQLDAARAWGADVVLLIVRCLEGSRLEALIREARTRQLIPLVEVTTDDEAKRALDAGATMIGVNARDLDTLIMNPSRAAGVLTKLPEDLVAIHLSGLATPRDVESVACTRADGALIGEALMRLDDPAALLTSMKQAAMPIG